MRRKVIAKVILVNDAGKILCLTRSKGDRVRAGEWDFPGGNLDEDEGHTRAVVREAAEETGIAINNPQLIYATTDAYEGDVLITFLFFVSHISGEPTVRLSREHEAFEWLTVDALRAKSEFPPFNAAIEFAVEHNLLA